MGNQQANQSPEGEANRPAARLDLIYYVTTNLGWVHSWQSGGVDFDGSGAIDRPTKRATDRPTNCPTERRTNRLPYWNSFIM